MAQWLSACSHQDLNLKSRKSNEPLDANKIITNNHMRPRFVSIGQN